MTQLATWLLGNGLMVLPLMGLAYIVGRRFPQKPALAHGLWLLVFVKLLTPPLVQWEVPGTWWPTLASSTATNEIEKAPLQATEPPPAIPHTSALEPLVADSSSPSKDGEPERPIATDLTRATPPSVLLLTEAIPAAAIAPTENSPPHQALIASTPWTAWLLPSALLLWALGAVGWLTLASIRLFRFHRLLRFAAPADKDLQELADSLAVDLGARRAPPVLQLPGNFAPMLWSFLGRTCILLPRDLLAQLPTASRTPLLLHELAHWRRGDHFVRYVELAALAAYWWHPAVWLARHKLREAEEECCDAWVLAAAPTTRRTYAVAILATLEFLAAKPQPLPVAGSGLSSFQHLHRRLTMMKNATLARSLRWPGRLVLLAVALLALPLGTAWSTGQPPEDQAAPQPPAEGGRSEAGRGRRTPPPPPSDDTPPARDDEPRERRGGPGAFGGPAPTMEDNKDEMLFVAKAEVRMNRIQLRYREEELREAMEKLEEAQQHLSRINSLREKGAASEEQFMDARYRVSSAERQVRLMKIRIEEAQEQHKILEERIALIEKGVIKGRMGVPPFGRSALGRGMAAGGNDPIAAEANPGGGRGGPGGASGGAGRGPGGGFGGPGGAAAGRGPTPGAPAGGGRPGAEAGPFGGGGRSGRGFPGGPPPEAESEKDEQIRQLKKELEQLRQELDKLKKRDGDR